MQNSLNHLVRTVILAGTITAFGGQRAQAQLYWDINGATTGSGTPGSAAWDTGTNWSTNSNGTSGTTSWLDGSSVIFSAGTESAGTWNITIANTIQANALTFRGTANTIHNISGGTINIGTGGLIIDSSAQGGTGNRSKTISSAIIGSGGITLAANGDLSATGGGSNSLFTLSGSNAFTGNVTITSGVVNATSNFGDLGNKLILNGGGLVDPNANVEITRDIEIGAAGGVIRAYGNTTNFRLAGALTGSGTLRRTDGGTAIITGDATGFTGTFAVDRAVLQVGNGFQTTNLAPNVSGIVIGTSSGAATFRYNLDTSLTLTTPVTFANAGSTLDWRGAGSDDVLTINGSFGVDSATGNIRASGGAVTFAAGAKVKVRDLQVTSTPANSDAAVVGTMNILEGATIETGYLNIGDGSNTAGIVNQSGGTVTIVPGGNGFRLGHWVNGATPGSVYNLTGGTLDGSGSGISIIVGFDGAATMNVSGTGVLKAQRLYVDAQGVDLPGIVNLQTGGTIEVGAGGTANDDTAGVSGSVLNLAGGTLRAVASSTWASKMDANTSTTSTIDITAGNSVTATGVLSGDGAIVKTGAGTLALNGVITHSGTITVQNGTLTTASNNVGSGVLGTLIVNGGGSILPGSSGPDSSFGTLYAAGLTFSGNGRFDLTGGDFSFGGSNDLISVFGTASITGGTITPVFQGTPTPGTYTLISAGGGLTASSLPTITGTGTSRLTFTPSVTANDLLLTVAGSAKTLTWAGSDTWDVVGANAWSDGLQPEKFYQYDSVTFDKVTAGTSTIKLVGSLTPSSTSVASSSDYIFTGTGTIDGGGSLIKSGTGTLTLDTTNTYTGRTSILDGKVVVGTGGTTGTLGGTGAIELITSTLVFNRSDNITLSRAFTGFEGTLQKDGSGSLTIGPGFLLLPRNLVINSGTVTVQGASFGGNRLEGSGLVTINSGATLIIPSGTAHAFGGSNTNMTDAFVMNGGTLTMNSEQYFNSLTLSGATINGTGEVRASNATNWTVTGSAPSQISNPLGTYNTLNLTVEDVTGSNAPDLILSGAINAQTGTFNQNGTGTVAYTGTTTAYPGTYNVNNGTLLMSGSITGTATVNVNSGAALGGTGTLGRLNVFGGTIAPGPLSGTGTLTTGNLSLDEASYIKFELSAAGIVGGVNDLLTVNGTLSLDGTLQITPLNGFSTGTYRLINYTGALTNNGLTLDPTFLATYPGSSVNLSTSGQVNLVVVPEPTTGGCLAAGLSGLLGLQRFRRRLSLRAA